MPLESYTKKKKRSPRRPWLESFQNTQEYEMAHLKPKSQRTWMSKVWLMNELGRERVPRRKETFKENYRLSKLEGASVLKGLRHLRKTKKATHLAQRSPTREDTVLASAPRSAEAWVQAICAAGNPRKQGLWRLTQGRMKSQTKKALSRSLLRATGVPSPKGPLGSTHRAAQDYLPERRDRSLG